MASKKKNRNEQIVQNFSELKNEVDYDDFIFKKCFDWLCEVLPDSEKEKMRIGNCDQNTINDYGLVYVMVIGGKIFKIGQTTMKFKGRLSSYNAGKRKLRARGTPSTTNYFVLQSLLAIGLPVQIYAYFAEKKGYQVFKGTKFAESGVDSFPTPKIIEKKINLEFIKHYGKSPIGNTQK
ncbi:MAG: GIY-YIG nuclease family protein [Gammaproteobacteria bacterium]